MRLLHTSTLYLKSFTALIPKYAILSHRWAEDDADEVSYQQFRDRSNLLCHGYTKIKRACELAQQAGLEWLWIDTCCIDKTSSAELSEAINSMFAWYRDATVCFAFLTETDLVYLHQAPDHVQTKWTHEWAEKAEYRPVNTLFSKSWFGRGWTLQELLAPHEVIFYQLAMDSDEEATFVGTRTSLSKTLSHITGIERQFLCARSPVWDASVAKRMSWASRRTTTRAEDIAYCLLGLFDVNMPLLYGEGTKAFQRLQEAIISQSDDETIFAWTAINDTSIRGMLAESPTEFWRYPCLKRERWRLERPVYRMTGRGLEFPITKGPAFWFMAFTYSPRLHVPLQCICGCEGGRGASLAVILGPNQKKQKSYSSWVASDHRHSGWSRQYPRTLFRSYDSELWYRSSVWGFHAVHLVEPSRQSETLVDLSRSAFSMLFFGWRFLQLAAGLGILLVVTLGLSHVPLVQLTCFLVGWSILQYNMWYPVAGLMLSLALNYHPSLGGRVVLFGLFACSMGIFVGTFLHV